MTTRAERTCTESLAKTFATDHGGEVFPAHIRIRRGSKPRPTRCWTGSLFEGATPYQRKEVADRLFAIQRHRDLLESGMSRKDAASVLGKSDVTLWRWEMAYRERGVSGLLPQTHKCGRRGLAEALTIPGWVCDAIERLQAMRIGAARAWRFFVETDPRCPPDLKKFVVERETLPPSLLRRARINRRRVTQIQGKTFSVFSYE
jgi:hypothetical protein